MRLTDVLLGVFKKKGIRPQNFRFVDRIPGNMYRGKHRVVPDLKKGRKLKMWNDLAIEEENIMYISRPYLTNEEGRYVPREIFQKGTKKFELPHDYSQPPMRSVYFGEILDGLNTARQWENY